MSTAAELAGNTGETVSALRERKKSAFSNSEEVNGHGKVAQTDEEQDNSKEEQVTWGRAPDGTGINCSRRLLAHGSFQSAPNA
jgi:hypothetical protein